MAYSNAGLGYCLDGVIARGNLLSLHTADPGTTGAGEDTAVPRVEAGWPASAGGPTVDSSQVRFEIPEGGGQRDYAYFGVWADDVYVTGGPLDQSERFSDNGGAYNFTATLSAASAA